jgi:hypothetical protein
MPFVMTACGNDPSGEQPYRELTHYDTLVIDGEQVWLRNYSSNKISQLYEKCDENNYNIVVFSEYLEEIGSGSINKGIVRFTVTVPEELLEWDDLKVFFEVIVEGKGWTVTVDEGDEPNGTFIEILTDDEARYQLIREGVSGTTTSLSDEWVFFVYVDRDCTITGESKVDEQVMYTLNPFTLRLKKGWNTVWHKQTYTSFGRSTFSMDIKNPDLKWVLISTVPTR